MPSRDAGMSAPRTWLLTVRLLELCAGALLAGAALEMWSGYQLSGRATGVRSDGVPLPLQTLWARIAAFSLSGSLFHGPLAILGAAGQHRARWCGGRRSRAA
jgi:hypothetical protein